MLNNFSSEIDLIAEKISNVDHSSDSISAMASESKEGMETLISSVEIVKDAFAEFTARINALGINLNKINDITVLINAIAGIECSYRSF